MTDIHELEQAWRDEPGNLNTFFALEEEYRRQQKWGDLIELLSQGPKTIRETEDFGTRVIETLQTVLEQTDDGATRATVYCALGNAFLEHREDRTEAMRAFQTAHKEYPQDTRSLECARRLYRDSDDWARVLLLYKLQLKVYAEPTAERADTLVKMAQVSAERLEDLDSAKTYLSEARSIDADHPFLSQLDDYYEKETTVLAQLNEALDEANAATKSGDSEFAAEWMLVAARLELEREGGDSEQAAEYAERAHGHDPANGEVKTLLGRLYAELGREGELDETGAAGVAVLAPMNIGEAPEESDDGVDDAHRATVKLDVAELADMAEVDRNARSAADSSEANEEETAEESAADAADGSSDELLAESAESAEEEEGLETPEFDLEAGRETLQSGWTEFDETSPSEVDESDLAGDESDPEDGEVSEGDAVDDVESPDANDPETDDGELPVDGEEVADAPQSEADESEPEIAASPKADSEPSEADSEVDGEATSDEEPSDADDEAAEQGELPVEETIELFRDSSEDPDTIEACLARMAEDPTDVETLDRYFALVETEEEFGQYLDVLEGSVKRLRNHDRQADLMVRAGEIAWKELDDWERAEFHFKRVKLLDAEREELRTFYETYYERKEDWTKLFGLLGSNLDPESPSYRETVVRAAGIATEKMSAPEKAVDLWRQVLQNDPDNVDAFSQLESIFRTTGKWTSLVELFREQVKSLDEKDTESKVDLLLRIADVYENELRREELVASTLEEVLEVDPERNDVFERLSELYAGSRRSNQLIQLLKPRADRYAEQGEVASAVELHFRIAQIWRETLKNVSQAVQEYERILELDPTNKDARVELRQVFEKRRDYESLFALQKAELDELSGEERTERLRELIALALDRMRSPDDAIPLLQSLLTEQPTDWDALQRLDGIFRRREQSAELAAILIKKAAATDDKEKQITALGEAGDLFRDPLKDVERACDLWNEILSLDPQNSKAMAHLTDAYIRTHDFDALDALYRDRKDLDRLFDLLDSAAATTEQDALKAVLYRRMATLAAEDLQSEDRVILSLESLREQSERPEVIAGELVPWYRKAGELDREVEMLEVVLESLHEEEVEQTHEIQNRIREIREQQGDSEAALRWALLAVGTQPSNATSRDTAERIARENDDLDALIAGFDSATEFASDDTKRLLFEKMGAIHAERGEVALAIDRYEQVRNSDPSDVGVLAVLEGLYSESGEWERQVDVLNAQILNQAESGADSAALNDAKAKVAQLQRQQIGNAEQAKETYLEILSDDPEHVESMRGLVEIARMEEDWGGVETYAVAELELVTDGARRTDILMSLGDLHHYENASPTRAVGFYADALQTTPGHEPAISALESLLETPEVAKDAALLIEPTLRENGAYGRLAPALEARQAVTDDEGEQVALLKELVSLYDGPMADSETGFDRAKQWFSIRPFDAESKQTLEQFGEKLDRWGDVVSTYSDAIPTGGGLSFEESELLRRRAAIEEEKLGRLEDAVSAHHRLRDVDPSDVTPLVSLQRLYSVQGNIDALVQTMVDRAEIETEQGIQIGLLTDAAELSDSQLGDQERTIELHQKVLELAPDHGPSIELLRALLRDASRFDDLGGLLEQKALDASDTKRREYFLELANVRAHKLSDRQGALDVLRELIHDNDVDSDAITELQLLDDALAEADPGDPMRLEIADLAEPAYRKSSDYRRLVATLETRRTIVSDPIEQVDLLDELASLYHQRVGQPDQAFEAVSAAVVLAPDTEERWERLEALAAQTDRLSDAVDTYSRAAEHASPAVKPALLTRVAELYEEHLGSAENAITYYEKAYDSDPDNIGVLVPLGDLYQRVGNHEKLAENLRVQADLGDPERRADFLRQLGVLEDEILGRSPEAILAYSDWLAMEPASVDALVALERLHEEAQNWDELADVLRQQATTREESTEQIRAFRKLAHLTEVQLGDSVGAVDVHYQLLEVDPTDADSLDELERLHRESGQWNEVASIYRAKLLTSRASDEAYQTEIEQKLAGVLADRLFDIDEALIIQRGVLERHPGQPEAIAAIEQFARDDQYLEQVSQDLAEHYRVENDWAALVGLYDRLQDKELDPDARVDYLLKMGRVRRDHLVDYDAALETFSSAWKLNVDRNEAHQELAALAETTERWSALTEVYEDVIPMINEPERRVSLYMRLGELYQRQLGDDVSAERSYLEALNVDERFVPAYEVLEPMLASQGRFGELVRLLERRYESLGVDNIDEGLLTLHSIAQLHDEMLEDPHSAVDTFERILEIEPRDEIAAAATTRLLRAQSRWDDLVGHYQRQIALTSDHASLVTLKSEMAQVVADEQNDRHAALEIHRDVLELEPTHQATVASLMGYIDDDVAAKEAAQILEPTFRQEQDWTSLAKVLEVQNVDSDAADIAQRMREVAVIRASHLNDNAGAIGALTQVLLIDPEDSEVRESLDALARHEQSWDQLTNAYGAVLEGNYGMSDQARAMLLFEKARVHEERMEQLEAAREGYEESLAIFADNEPCFDALDRVYARTKNWQSMASLYERRAELTNDRTERERWLAQLANLYEEVLDDVPAAIEIYQRLSAESHKSGASQRALERLLAYDQRWEDLAELYREQAAVASDPDVVLDRRYRLASLYEAELDRFEDALEIYRDILSVDPNYYDARAALEGLSRDLAIKGEDVRHERIALLDLLLEVADPSTERLKVIRWLEERESLIDDVEEKVRIYHRIADLTENSDRSDDRIQAMIALAKAFQRDPNDEVQRRVNAIAVQANAWDRLIPVYLTGLELTDDGSVQEQLLVAIAEIYAGPMNDQDSAVSAYQQVLEVAPENHAALSHLERLYSELELWHPLVDVLMARADSVYDVDEKERVLRRVARIEDEVLQQPESAIAVLLQLRELSPDELDYVESLQLLYQSTSRWRDLESLLQEKVGLQSEPESQVKSLRLLARLQDETLHDEYSAIESYRGVVDLDPDDVRSIRALIVLYEKTDQWHELLDALALERDFIDDVELLNANDLKTGGVLINHVDAPHDALGYFRDVLLRTPTSAEAQSALMKLLGRGETRDEAAEVLRKTYVDLRQWRELEQLYEVQLQNVDDVEQRVQIYRSLAQAQEEHLDSPQMAFITYGRTLRESPGDPLVWASLERLSAQLQNPDEFVAVLEDCVESPIEDPDIKRALHIKLGRLYAGLEEWDESVTHLTAALDLDEFDNEALLMLDSLYQRMERWPELQSILERRVETVDPELLVETRFRLGYLKEAAFKDYDGALEQYRRVFLDEPSHGPTVDGMERLLRRPELRLEVAEILDGHFTETGEHERLSHTLIQKLESLEHPLERSELLERIANLQLDEFGNMEVGYAYLCRAFREDPKNTEIQIRLESLAKSTGLQEELVALYEEIVESLDETDRSNELSLVAAKWSAEELGDDRGAWTIYSRILEADPEHEETLGGMEVIARKLGDVEALTTVLEKQTVILYDPDQRRNAFVELGGIRNDQERFDDAIEAFRQANLIDEGSPEILRALIELFEVTENYPELVDHLEQLAYVQQETDARYATFKRMGQCAHVLLKDPHRAIDAYVKALGLSPDSTEATVALKSLYAEIENWHEYRELVRRQISSETDTSKRIALHYEAAKVDIDGLDDPNSAIDEYRSIIALDPDDDVAFESLTRELKQQSRWAEVRDLFQQALDATPASDAERLIDLRVQMAEVSAMFLGDEDGAVDYLTSILAIEPGHQKALGVLSDLYARQGRWEDAVEMLTRKINDGRDPAEQMKSLQTRAQIYRNELGKPEEAATDLARVVQLDPKNSEAMAELKALYSELGAFAPLYEWMNFEASTLEPAARVPLYVEMADVATDKLNDPTKAMVALEQAYAIEPEELSVVEPLLNAYLAAGQTDRAEPLVDSLVEQLRAQRRMKDVVRFLHLKGRLAEQKGDDDAAWTAFDGAHKVDASYIPNLLSLGRLLYRRQAWDDALKVFQTLQLQQMNIKDDELKVDVYYHLGMIRWYQGDSRRAKDMFQRATAIDASHQPSKDALAQLG